ncbi:hypothetical protein FACS1894170_12370 [Planctomycetales bacterium]|nr:hypothetical protein FACS1894170_12370 [Planctomycetales bacterium]
MKERSQNLVIIVLQAELLQVRTLLLMAIKAVTDLNVRYLLICLFHYREIMFSVQTFKKSILKKVFRLTFSISGKIMVGGIIISYVWL